MTAGRILDHWDMWSSRNTYTYKDREEDRRRGLEAGADYYLAKSSFHDETLLEAVQMLIGEAVE